MNHFISYQLSAISFQQSAVSLGVNFLKLTYGHQQLLLLKKLIADG